MNNLWIIITTINKPTKAIFDYSNIAKRFGWKLLIVADAKTPSDAYYGLNCVYLSLDAQKTHWEKFSQLVPLNHYCRKNIGYLYAFLNGAEWVFDTDDDNIPLEGFAENLISNRAANIVSLNGFVNVYKHFSKEHVWPRGIPLADIQHRGDVVGTTSVRPFYITQFLADEDPDVDAIYRLTNNHRILFDRSATPILLRPGTWSPFNSQATLIHRKYFRTLYLPCHVPFRMTDIWRSFVAQKILWEDKEGVAFVGPIVVQERNPHDFFHDFKDEILGYLHNHEISANLDLLSLAGKSPNEQMLACYKVIHSIGLVEDREFDVMGEWNQLFDRLSD